MDVTVEMWIAALAAMAGAIGFIFNRWQDSESKHIELREKLRAENVRMIEIMLSAIAQNTKALDDLRAVIDLYPKVENLEALIRASSHVRTTTAAKK